MQYYHGLVGKGEMVMLRRQPNNQYDANAVQVGPIIPALYLAALVNGDARS